MDRLLKMILESMGPQVLGVIVPQVMRLLFEAMAEYMTPENKAIYADKILDLMEDAGEKFGLPKVLDALLDEIAAAAREAFDIADNDTPTA